MRQIAAALGALLALAGPAAAQTTAQLCTVAKQQGNTAFLKAHCEKAPPPTSSHATSVRTKSDPRASAADLCFKGAFPLDSTAAAALPCLLNASNSNPKAASRIGDIYWWGAGVAKDAVEALKWFRSAAEKKDAYAELWLAMAYENGMGIPQDYYQALVWYLSAASQGDISAQKKMGGIFEAGWWTPRNPSQALAWYRRAADQGDGESKGYVAKHGDVPAVSPQMAPPPPASARDAYAMGKAALAEHNVLWARYWLLRAATSTSDPQTEALLGQAYADGVGTAAQGGIDPDDKQAMVWFQRAADQNSPAGEVGMGDLYLLPSGPVPKDCDQGAAWYRKAADQSDIAGEQRLAQLYWSGCGNIAQDYATALSWYVRAASQGSISAQTWLGYVYDRGWGTTRDPGQALAWYRKAAEQGDADARAYVAAHAAP